MNNIRKLTRILLIGMGIYLLFEITFPLLFGLLPFLCLPRFPESAEHIWQLFLMLIFDTALALLIIFLLIRKADFWAERIVGLEEEKPELPKGFWIPVAFRLAAVFAGILCMYRLLTNIITAIYSYIYSRSFYTHASDFFKANDLVTWAIQLALVIYLLCGAPHFVRWHIKKILEQNENNTKQPDALSTGEQA
jgi:hypothetical protein